MTNSPNWISVNLQLGWPKPATVDAGILQSDGTSKPSAPLGAVAQFRDIGTTNLGVGTFIYLPGVTATVAGDVCLYRLGSGGSSSAPANDVNGGSSTIRWTGTGNTGFPVAVATAATNIQTTWGWYQIQGAAIVNISGTVAAGDKAYFGQTSTLTSTVVGGKQILGAQANSASDIPTTGKAVYTINNPVVQSQIT